MYNFGFKVVVWSGGVHYTSQHMENFFHKLNCRCGIMYTCQPDQSVAIPRRLNIILCCLCCFYSLRYTIFIHHKIWGGNTITTKNDRQICDKGMNCFNLIKQFLKPILVIYHMPQKVHFDKILLHALVAFGEAWKYTCSVLSTCTLYTSVRYYLILWQ